MNKLKIIRDDNTLNIDLYHGTSTIFLDSILESGLGGVNPVIEWNLIELCKEVYQLSEEYLLDNELFQISGFALKLMSEQSNNGSFNYQHGETYLSPSKLKASQYAIHKEYGSEILSYIINFLKELINKEIPYVTKDLYSRFSKVYHLINSKPSPLLIQIKDVNVNFLKNEFNKEPFNFLKAIDSMVDESEREIDLYTQPFNFRLKSKIEVKKLKFYLINIQYWDYYTPKYNYYEIFPLGRTTLK